MNLKMNWRSLFTVEIPLLISTYSLMLQGSIMTNLYIYRSCYVILKYNESECSQLGNEDNNITHYLEPLVQPVVNNINMVQSVVFNGVPLIFCLCVGTWSDKFGRKPFLLICIAGMFLAAGMNTIFIHFSNLSPWWFVVSGIPALLTGGFTTLMITITTTIADLTTEKNRVLRLGLFEVMFGLASVLGNLSSSFLFYATSYETIYIMVTCLTGISFIYSIFLPESLPHKKTPFSLREVAKAINFKELVKHTVRKRENNARMYIFSVIGILIVNGLIVGELSVQTLFLRNKLHWTLTKLTVVSAVTGIGNIIGTFVGTYLLYKTLKIKEMPLIIFGLVTVSVGDVLRGIATEDYYAYAANAVGVFFVLPTLMLKTIISFVIPPEEMGKVFALMSIILSIDSMVANVLFPLVYEATLNVNSGAYNFVSLGLHISVLFLTLLLSRLKIPYYKPPEGEDLNQQKKESNKLSLSINNFEVLGVNEKRYSNRLSLDLTDIRRLSQSPNVY